MYSVIPDSLTKLSGMTVFNDTISIIQCAIPAQDYFEFPLINRYTHLHCFSSFLRRQESQNNNALTKPCD